MLPDTLHSYFGTPLTGYRLIASGEMVTRTTRVTKLTRLWKKKRIKRVVNVVPRTDVLVSQTTQTIIGHPVTLARMIEALDRQPRR